MGVNARLVQSIKPNLAERTSADLREMLAVRDVGRYSDEAFAAAQEVLDERARGERREPPPQLPPPRPPTAAEREAVADALLRRQVRLVGAYYYGLTAFWLLMLPLLARLFDNDPLATAAAASPAVLFWLVGWGVRRFSPVARGVATVFSLVQVAGFPVGTVIGLYCFDKLMRADHLFGAGRHPGERAASGRNGR